MVSKTKYIGIGATITLTGLLVWISLNQFFTLTTSGDITCLGTPIYSELIKYLFVNGFHRLWLLVAAYNQRARNLYTKLGFKEEGIQREGLYKNDQYFDYIMMSMLQNG